MALTDPRTTIKSIVDTYIAANPILKDDGLTSASVGSLWEKGPELMKSLFYSIDFDVIITFGEPRSRSVRNIQDVPDHFQMAYPITVSTVDKPLTGALVCTAMKMQYKVTLALRTAIGESAQSAPAATPAYTLFIVSDVATYKRVGGVNLWEAVHSAQYETDYG